jgi:prepilin-type N-terminal cleavage/methylation domain-containing protein
MKINIRTYRAGFTLIETLIAMAIFTVGILGLFGMQAAAIKENLTANNITTGTAWAADQIEQLIGRDIVDADNDNDGCKGLDHRKIEADGFVSSGSTQPIYNIYWNVAGDCTMNAVSVDLKKIQSVRVIVTRSNSSGSEEDVAVINYIKNTRRNRNK